MALSKELPYCADTAALFDALADQPWAVFLDSGRHDPAQSRYDIVAAEPWATVVTRGGMTEIRTAGTARISPEDPFAILRDVLRCEPEASGPLPFHGGAIGYFGYDLGRHLERLPVWATDDGQIPDAAFGIYSWAIVVDHLEGRSWLAWGGPHPPAPAVRDAICRRFSEPPCGRTRAPFCTSSSVRSSFSVQSYVAAFERIMRYIHDGDCYQVNLAQRFEVTATGDPWTAYQSLRVSNPAPFAAYLNLPFAQVLRASPERFLQVRDGRVMTQPIKGTRPRAGHPRLDAERAEELRASGKDRAENVMIVDLLRNDLAKNCRIGSVRVPKLFEVQSFPNVHHLVSTIEGELAAGRDAIDLLRGAFPGGSITGAPKLRAMEIIEALEPYRRGLYCGSIGYVGYDGAMDTNIAIRTLVYRSGQARFWAGGGIVAESLALEEYQETLDKAAPFLQLVQRCADTRLLP